MYLIWKKKIHNHPISGIIFKYYIINNDKILTFEEFDDDWIDY